MDGVTLGFSYKEIKRKHTVYIGKCTVRVAKYKYAWFNN